MQHGYVPLIGIRSHIMRPLDNPYRSWRVGLYWMMIELDGCNLSFLWARKLMYSLEWHKGLRPRFTTWNNNLIWQKARDKNNKPYWKRIYNR